MCVYASVKERVILGTPGILQYFLVTFLIRYWCCFSLTSREFSWTPKHFLVFLFSKSLIKWIHVVIVLLKLVSFAFSSAFSFSFSAIRNGHLFKDLKRRCVVNILTLNTVNQQSYHECQLYYFYSRKIKLFSISRSK